VAVPDPPPLIPQTSYFMALDKCRKLKFQLPKNLRQDEWDNYHIFFDAHMSWETAADGSIHDVLYKFHSEDQWCDIQEKVLKKEFDARKLLDGRAFNRPVEIVFAQIDPERKDVQIDVILKNLCIHEDLYISPTQRFTISPPEYLYSGKILCQVGERNAARFNNMFQLSLEVIFQQPPDLEQFAIFEDLKIAYEKEAYECYLELQVDHETRETMIQGLRAIRQEAKLDKVEEGVVLQDLVIGKVQTITEISVPIAFENYVNTCERLDKEQKFSVLNLLAKEAQSGTKILAGPPGTGKTRVVAECIIAAIRSRMFQCILANTYTKEALRFLFEAFIDAGDKISSKYKVLYIESDEENNWYNEYTDPYTTKVMWHSLRAHCERWTKENPEHPDAIKHSKLMTELELDKVHGHDISEQRNIEEARKELEMVQSKIEGNVFDSMHVIFATIGSSISTNTILQSPKFQLLIVDNAQNSPEVDLMLVVSRFRDTLKRLILVGDPTSLEPYTASRDNPQYSVSLIKKALKNGWPRVKWR